MKFVFQSYIRKGIFCNVFTNWYRIDNGFRCGGVGQSEARWSDIEELSGRLSDSNKNNSKRPVNFKQLPSRAFSPNIFEILIFFGKRRY